MSCPVHHSESTGEYTKEKLNTVRVYNQRGIVHSVTDSTLVSHVAFTIKDEDGEDSPINLPLTCVLGRYNPSMDYARMNDQQLQAENRKSMDGPVEAYLHENAASMLYKAIKASRGKGVRVCITSTKVDGVVLFLTPNGHSLNYRSAVLHGTANLVPNADTEKKHWAMRLLTNHMWSGRWETTYPVAKSSIENVQVIEVSIRSASAKVRASNIGDFDPAVVLGKPPDWPQKDVWSGVVPVYEVFDKPVSSKVMDESKKECTDDVLTQIETVHQNRNVQSKKYAQDAATIGLVEQDMKEKIQIWERMCR